MDISELLMFVHKEGASDLHISSGEPPMARIHGEMRRIEMPALSKDDVHVMLYDVLSDQQRKRFEENYELDFSIELKGIARFRVNAFRQARGEGVVFRVIPSKILTLEELGLPKILREICHNERGLVLVTGPTGSGKSTTLASMIDVINGYLKGHIITIEDPIEFVHESKMCLINQREVGAQTHNFANALRSALREDPDIILVGEMRDLETISLALTAAETGHLVFSTLHTSGTAGPDSRPICRVHSGHYFAGSPETARWARIGARHRNHDRDGSRTESHPGEQGRPAPFGHPDRTKIRHVDAGSILERPCIAQYRG
jgi:twitching motility protein PilT